MAPSSKPRPATPWQKRADKAERARKLLAGGTLTREDSDDELGTDEHPWEWIYARRENGEGDEESADEENRSKKRKARSAIKSRGEIVGAKMGTFSCKVGDSVLLKAEGQSQCWVGLIQQFLDDDDGEKSANFMWFANEKEIRPKIKEKKRSDFLPNELYLTPDTDINPLESINGTAYLLSEKAFNMKYPTGKISKRDKEYGKTYICRRGCDTRTATYTKEFEWETIKHSTEEEVVQLHDRIKSETKSTVKKRRGQKRKMEDDDFGGDLTHDEDGKVETPRKKQKFSSVTTPRKPRTPSKLLTPSHRKVVIKKPLEFTPLGTRMLDPEHVESSPFQTARSRLHVSSVPTSLPCREDEFASVYSHLEAAIVEGTGACIYISGTPGTGKTATVREVVAQLNASVLADELDDFIFLEINGMKVTDPHQSYSLLWEALKGDRVSPTHALDLLEREFNHPSPRRVPCVVLMDELDQLVTKNQSVMYNFFNWPGLRHSRLIVLAVANTMDLPERTLSNKISSRLGLTRITFPGYTHDQLMKIIQSRLTGVPNSIVDPDAIQFASRKVAAVSGDARRALDICRRAVELAEAEILALPAPDTPSKSGRKANRDGAEGAGKPSRNLGTVTIATVKRAINEATTSPLQQCLRSLPLAAKILLAALLVKTRRTGIGESILGEVMDEAKRMARMESGSHLEFLLKDTRMEMGAGTSVGMKDKKVPRVLAMGGSAVDLMEAGIVGLETRRAERTGKIRLCIGEEDVKQAFKDDPEVKGFGF
ncbi:origin recognition complex subunit 1 [Drepanopeziza brunnea f. sp. 'multigermtubi' MB_m1]|uniref:Origin recognition complex subunit 1 n=1 Tax=Marssonina brunnea f. sp. multigermtubi (strain MB_m1) TaxID=1072389 RepID=K1X5S3_MARBU|nr:origin recognition complex subunit 1 [Drepanopeziza brunnea f. sp. 'multigermtubi' MB_m1]EKD16003.1 origin recognition complex subunit 1 [Drepanopeziza brunnea f. sp. 'multigermtubi' MB_m1]